MTTVEALRGEPTQVPRMLVAGAIGNVLEWYDFAAYGYFASAFGAISFLPPIIWFPCSRPSACSRSPS
jgi:hypothetical protein